MRLLISALVLTFIILSGCQNQGNKMSPTIGYADVEVDPAVYPILIKEKKAFDSLYTKAKIKLKETAPLQGAVDLLNNKTKMLVSPRYFNSKELNFMHSQKLDVQIFKFCYEAIAVISSPQNNTDKIRVDEIRDALLGNSSRYSFIIPQNNTSTYEYIKDEILNGKDPKNAEIAPNDSSVLKKIEDNNYKLGIISFNIVQDSSKVKFIQVGKIQNNSDTTNTKGVSVDYFTPHPGYVYKKYYPLTQTVYIFLHEIDFSPASGFTTFLTSYEGQRIALNENLAPAAVPVKINQL